LTKYGTIENDPARLYVYDGSSIGCMELHDLQVEEYIGTCGGNHNSSRLIEDLKPRDSVKEHTGCFNYVSKNRLWSMHSETHPSYLTCAGICMDSATGK